MSERNVELHVCLIEAFNARDIEAMIAYCDPSVEWNSHFAAVGGAVYHGHDGMRQWHRDLEEVWGNEIRLEPVEEYFALGPRTLAFQAIHARGRHSGAEVVMPAAQVFRWRDGLIVYFKGYAHIEDALRDLGVSQNELEPIDR